MKTHLMAATAAIVLAACGGGGGGGESPATPQPVVADLQGFWSGPLTGTALTAVASTQAVVLPDGTGWLLLFPAAGGAAPTGMIKASFTVSGAGYAATGKLFALDSEAVSTVALANVTANATMVTAALTQSGVTGTSNASLASAAAYRTPAVLSNMAGTWEVTLSSGAVVVNWQVSATGVVTGTDTKGCLWTGTVATHPAGNAVYTYATTENCGAGLVTAFNGIGVLNGARTGATVFITSPGDARGFVLSFTKQ